MSRDFQGELVNLGVDCACSLPIPRYLIRKPLQLVSPNFTFTNRTKEMLDFALVSLPNCLAKLEANDLAVESCGKGEIYGIALIM